MKLTLSTFRILKLKLQTKYMTIHERIRARMADLKIKGIDITKATKVSSGGVSQWVNGITVPKGKNILILSKLLKCTPEWLLEGIGSPGSISEPKKAPLVSLKELQGYISSGAEISTGVFNKYYESNDADFCINYNELGEFELGELILLFSKQEMPRSDKTVIYQITNKYGSHIVVGKYYEILGAPHLKNAHTLDGAIPDIELDSVEHQFIATMIEMRGCS